MNEGTPTGAIRVRGRRGRPPLSAYPSSSTRGAARAAAGSPDALEPRPSGPPRKRGRPPRSSANVRVAPPRMSTPPRGAEVEPWSESTPSTFASPPDRTAWPQPEEAAATRPPTRSPPAATPAAAQPPLAQRPAASPPAGSPPALVFQCSSCLAIVGDTYSWVTAQQTLNVLVLSGATDKVGVLEPPVTCAEPGPCLGCTYSELECVRCHHTLGRKYHTTPRELDELREAFCLDPDAVMVYQFGSTSTSGHRTRDTRAPPPAADTLEMPAPRAPRARVGSSQERAPSESSSDQLTGNDVDKIRKLLMVMGERLMRVENYLRISPAESTAESSADARRSATPRGGAGAPPFKSSQSFF